MNAGPTPPRPDDDASDPLLAALRQRLGDYGQAPPPGAWAAIREQLPPPRPWWQRTQPLLFLLGLLFASTIAIWRGQLAQWSQGAIASQRKGSEAAKYSFIAPSLPRDANRKIAPVKLPSVAVASAPTSSPQVAAPFSTNVDSAVTLSATNSFAKPTTPLNAPVYSPTGRPAHGGKTAAAFAGKRPVDAGPIDYLAHRKQVLKRPALAHASTHRQKPSISSAELAVEQESRVEELVKPDSISPDAASSVAASRSATSHSKRHHVWASGSFLPKGILKRHRSAPIGTALSQVGRRARIHLATHLATTDAQLQPRLGSSEPVSGPHTLVRPNQVDSLALRTAALAPLLPLPQPVLTTRVDSAWPTLPRARRWSVLVLAGPTLSYRTLGPAPTLAARHPDFARLERPALGLGTQVQVRRVLSGRWALAAGLGYHEYATRLAIGIVDTSGRSPRSVRQRDVYRVLTLPVQVSYALGVPRQRLTWGLLLGMEPTWYLGGRSTEGSDCGCQQRAYPADSAKTSPYRSSALALSLGLDLRYRLGGPASRWRWVVQPTARYIITPFVRSDATGFTRRQPFSLGLLTGFSWDLR